MTQTNFTPGYSRLGAGALPDRWGSRAATYSSEALVIEGHPVMERWEAPYMQAFAAVVTRNGGRILECGFGMGLSASAIQAYAPSEHVIIEANEQVFGRLQQFAREAVNPVTPLCGLATAVAPTLEPGSFDGIFYDTYPLNAEEQHTHQFAFIASAYHLLRPGGILSYCNLTSTGVLRNQYPSWEALFAATQLPQLLSSGVPESDIKGMLLFKVLPPPTCQYFQHSMAMIPLIIKS